MSCIRGATWIGSRWIAAAIVLACGAAAWMVSTPADAQINNSDYWLYQPQQSAPVGRAWCNADRSVEYWAYVVGEYQFADAGNDNPLNRWRLAAERVSGTNYGSYVAFRTAVLALPQMEGKTILFQHHSVAEETVAN